MKLRLGIEKMFVRSSEFGGEIFETRKAILGMRILKKNTKIARPCVGRKKILYRNSSLLISGTIEINLRISSQ